MNPMIRPTSRAFTLVELLVVVSIIALLLAILVPALGKARDAATAVTCMSDLHQIGLASQMYLDENRGEFWRYYFDESGGRRWWFGFEAGGPGQGVNRPLDVAKGTLGSVIDNPAERLHCPAFDYDDPQLVRKFDKPSASYGFNINLGSSVLSVKPIRRNDVTHPSQLMVFTDGIHFDFNANNRYNEGHYVLNNPGASFASGYAHFRHGGKAQALMMDGHVETKALSGPVFAEVGGGAAGNLDVDYVPN